MLSLKERERTDAISMFSISFYRDVAEYFMSFFFCRQASLAVTNCAVSKTSSSFYYSVIRFSVFGM